jgi:ABC-type uncharacterized transport system auxiliary subunit
LFPYQSFVTSTTKENRWGTEASDLVITNVFSQFDDDDILHAVAHFSRKHSPAEINYEIYDKELLTIVRAFKEWHPLLEGSAHTIEVISNHRNLIYVTTNRLLNYHQTRWFEILSHLNFKANYRPRKAHGKANATTRQG